MAEINDIINSFYEDIGNGGWQECQNFWDCIAKGNWYRYNVNNQILLYKQHPQAELVAPYEAWKEKGYIPRRHSAILADKDDMMCKSQYLYASDTILRLPQEVQEKLSWSLEVQQDIDRINQSFRERSNQFADTISKSCMKCFQEMEADIYEEIYFAREFAEYASKCVIMQRCGYLVDEMPELLPYLQMEYENLSADKKMKLVRETQKDVSAFAYKILSNIGMLMKNEKERDLNEQYEQNRQIEIDTEGFDTGRNRDAGQGDQRGGIREDNGRGISDTITTGDEMRKERDSGNRQSDEDATELEGHRISDFGRHIGGARKEIWAARGLNLDDFEYLTPKEREAFVNKNQVWKKPDYEALKHQGVPVEVIYFYKLVRDAAPVNPVETKQQEAYIRLVSDIRDETMKCKKVSDIRNVYQMLLDKRYLIAITRYHLDTNNEYKGLISNRLLKVLQESALQLKYQAQRKQFLYTPEEKILSEYSFVKYDEKHIWTVNYDNRAMIEYDIGYGKHYVYPDGEFADREKWQPNTWYAKKMGKVVGINFESEMAAKEFVIEYGKEKLEKQQAKKTQRKRKWVPELLEHIERMGMEDVRNGKMMEGEDILREFAIRGGEFGNWLSDKERQANLNMCYEAFCDLAEALEIERTDISLDGKLAIAFGARGHGSALAHFEPMTDVINLTKMKGAGSLAHEWGHALDFITRELLGGIPEEYSNLINTLKWKTLDGKRVETDFYKHSKEVDKYFSKTDQGYWSCDEELFARAFACYVTDKVTELGGRSDYLCGHSEMAIFHIDDKILYAYPRGEERKVIHDKMAEMIDLFKERGVLHHQEYQLMRVMEKSR